jgi:flavin reductase (DIM6/NTAB) family NADH-FMN oxidoreductase RutF
MITPDDMKQVMRRWASTVTVITTKHENVIYGLTATAFSSLAVDPPMVFVCINTKTRTHPLIDQSGIFCVNFLTPAMKAISDRFAGRMPDTERFAGLAHYVAETGAPVLSDALAYLDCKVVDKHSGGDHTIFIGQVLSAKVHHPDALPLIYVNGKYRNVGDDD